MKEHFVVLVTTAPALHASTLELATRLAGRSNAVLVFLHVVPIRTADGVGMLHGALKVASGEDEAWVRAQIPTDPGVRFRHRVEAGEPEDVIARFVENNEVDLVVAEEPPRMWISEVLWRGLAERLIRRLDCPVVIGGPGFLRSVEPAVAPIPSSLEPRTVGELLNAMLDARADALRRWMDHAADAVRRIAVSDTVRAAAAMANRAEGQLDPRSERRLLVELDEHQRALRAIGWELAIGERTWGPDRMSPAAGQTLVEFLERVKRHGCSASLPIAVEQTPDRLVVFASATVDDDAGMLLFAFDAEAEFLRILGQPGPLPSFETYAFDGNGLMLSNSRFPEHLVQAGLLPEEGTQTPLHLRVAEPAEGPSEGWPLTHMARRATQFHDGFNTEGYRDYRGVPVVGAWRWIPEYGFGIAAEVDRDAAFR